MTAEERSRPALRKFKCLSRGEKGKKREKNSIVIRFQQGEKKYHL